MKEIHSLRANGSVELLTIIFDQPIPDLKGGSEPHQEWLWACRRHYRSQASLLVEAMEKTLPGGLMDALLGVLLERKASIFKVPDLILTRGEETT